MDNRLLRKGNIVLDFNFNYRFFISELSSATTAFQKLSILDICKVFINSYYEIKHGFLRYVGAENCSDGAPDDCHMNILLQCIWREVLGAPSWLDKRLP